MTTAERVTIACGGGYPLLASFYNGCEIVIVGTIDEFIPALEKATEAFAEISKMLDDVFAETTWNLTKWYNPIGCHNYRKMHRITPRRVVKRRDRQSRGSISLLKVDCTEELEEE